jgi:aspartyl protease family protein
MAAGWLGAGCAAAFSLLYFAEIKDTARRVLGLPAVTMARPDAGEAGRGRSAAASRPFASGVVELSIGANGHYFATAEMNGRPVEVMVDTGASMVALTAEDARKAGIFVRDSDYTQRVATANGIARMAPVTLDSISIGAITVRNVPAAVGEPGSLGTTLLGMTFLGRLQRVDMRQGRLVLYE